ncbi:helix-turn-helix domain-containing protein [Roseobacter sp. WL0113]|uniref:Helix-turn-helix domain-containing protein n=1 Tax=Roseobacter sinensis TaxID=2931391 RepID=A0ABT3BKX2_9RHOB|nr:helix-turn-helix domain-containing protein [Roseobacter sp. WL0113]
MGEPVKQYITARRLEAAARDLAKAEHVNLLQTALDCGFQSHSAVSKAFRARFGMSPSTFRKDPAAARKAPDPSRQLLIAAPPRGMIDPVDVVDLPIFHFQFRASFGTEDGRFFARQDQDITHQLERLLAQPRAPDLLVMSCFPDTPQQLNDADAPVLFGRASARRSPEFLANVMRGYRHNPKRYPAALAERQALSAIIDDFLGDAALWLLPVTAVGAFKHMAPTSDRNGVRDHATPLEISRRPANYFDALTSFVTPISLTGHPVVALPLGLDKNGMPIGAQLIGGQGQERRLIRSAKRLCDVLRPRVCPMLVQT